MIHGGRALVARSLSVKAMDCYCLEFGFYLSWPVRGMHANLVDGFGFGRTM